MLSKLKSDCELDCELLGRSDCELDSELLLLLESDCELDCELESDCELDCELSRMTASSGSSLSVSAPSETVMTCGKSDDGSRLLRLVIDSSSSGGIR